MCYVAGFDVFSLKKRFYKKNSQSAETLYKRQEVSKRLNVPCEKLAKQNAKQKLKNRSVQKIIVEAKKCLQSKW